MKKPYIDERTEQINGQVSFLFLMLTQLALGGVLVYKRYVLGLPQEEYNEIRWLLLFSIGGYWSLRLYISGILPVVSLKTLLLMYGIAVAVISIPTYFIHGLPAPERWFEVLYPFIGVAVALGFYSLVAYLGRRRLDKYLLD